VYTGTLTITPEVLNLIAATDELKGAWNNSCSGQSLQKPRTVRYRLASILLLWCAHQARIIKIGRGASGFSRHMISLRFPAASTEKSVESRTKRCIGRPGLYVIVIKLDITKA
jgi:hypothetical protein